MQIRRIGIIAGIHNPFEGGRHGNSCEFEVEGATSSKYDEVIRRLTEIGQRVSDGQMYHICYGDKQRLQVINGFESQAKLDAFGVKR